MRKGDKESFMTRFGQAVEYEFSEFEFGGVTRPVEEQIVIPCRAEGIAIDKACDIRQGRNDPVYTDGVPKDCGPALRRRNHEARPFFTESESLQDGSLLLARHHYVEAVDPV